MPVSSRHTCRSAWHSYRLSSRYPSGVIERCLRLGPFYGDGPEVGKPLSVSCRRAWKFVKALATSTEVRDVWRPSVGPDLYAKPALFSAMSNDKNRNGATGVGPLEIRSSDFIGQAWYSILCERCWTSSIRWYCMTPLLLRARTH